MAIFKPGPIIEAISGKVGGSVFALGKGSGTIRNNRAHIAHQSRLSADHAFRYATLSRLWSQCTEAELSSWTVAANASPSPNRFGIRRRLSPFQFFLWNRWPFLMYQGSYSWIPVYWSEPYRRPWTAPPRRSVTWPDFMELSGPDGPSGPYIYIEPDIDAGEAAARVQISRSHSTTRKPRPFWSTVFNAVLEYPGTVIDLEETLYPLTGEPATGERLAVRMSFYAEESLPTAWYYFDWYWPDALEAYPPDMPYPPE